MLRKSFLNIYISFMIYYFTNIFYTRGVNTSLQYINNNNNNTNNTLNIYNQSNVISNKCFNNSYCFPIIMLIISALFIILIIQFWQFCANIILTKKHSNKHKNNVSKENNSKIQIRYYVNDLYENTTGFINKQAEI